MFRKEELIKNNILNYNSQIDYSQRKKIIDNMWSNYAMTFVEYIFLHKFRKEKKFIEVNGKNILDNIMKKNKPVIFVSGHFANFELMSMEITKNNIKLATIYRPLNNYFLNPFMEYLRKKYICKNQVKKGISGTKKILSFFKKGSSIALMIDQRVSEGIRSNFFNHEAFTTTIPAQFVKKFNCKIVPIYIERTQNNQFKLTIHDPLKYSNQDSIESITLNLNGILEKMILKNPEQWIWTHNRWK